MVAAHAVAERLGDPHLTASADAPFVHGMDVALLVTAFTSLAAAALVAILLPRTVPADQGAMVQETADTRQ
ncbi:hypothetical protein ACWELB_18575 [Streptomyces asiaticus]